MAGDFDYIIVGAGSAGCVLANRLTQDSSNRVLLLEAGGPDKSWLFRMPLGFMMAAANPDYDWGYASEPDERVGGRSIPLPRGRVMGGCSSVNGMIYMRGHSGDYDHWRQLGCTGWGYDDVLPYFRKMESSWRGGNAYHGDSGPLSITPVDDERLLSGPLRAAATAAGYKFSDDLSGKDQEGVAQCEVTVDRKGNRASTSRAYLDPARKRPNLTIVSTAFANKVIVEDGRATGVEYRVNGAAHRATARKEVILSAGTYNSAQLLMLSGIGPAAELRRHGIEVVRDLAGVGRNLSEHPLVYMTYAARKPNTFLSMLRIDRAVGSVLRWWVGSGGPFSTQIVSSSMLVRTRPELSQPDIQLMFLPVRLDAKLYTPGIGTRQDHVFSIMVIQLHPESRGWMELRSASPEDKPAIHLNLLSTPNDFAEIRRGIGVVRKIFGMLPQSDLVAGELAPGPNATDDEALDDFIRQGLKVTQHPVGTCSMGIGPEAVVDPELRVKGIEGLRVVDASIMPTVPGANINAAVIMVAEKASDMILGRATAQTGQRAPEPAWT